MLIHPTVERLRSLGLAAMADTLVELQNNPEAAEMSHADWLGLLIDREATFRDNRRLSRRLTAAKLRLAQAAMGPTGTKVSRLSPALGVTRQTLSRPRVGLPELRTEAPPQRPSGSTAPRRPTPAPWRAGPRGLHPAALPPAPPPPAPARGLPSFSPSRAGP